jgi:hypothetical protein
MTFAVVSDSGTLPEESSFFTSVGHLSRRYVFALALNVLKPLIRVVSSSQVSIPIVFYRRWIALLR